MPHALTPLGRQFRSVLANLSKSPRLHSGPNTRFRQFRAPNGGRGIHSSTPGGRAAEANVLQHEALVAEEVTREDGQGTSEDASTPRPRVIKDVLGEALKEAGYTVSQYQRRQADLAHDNAVSQNGSGDGQKLPKGEAGLEHILARYIREEKDKGSQDAGQARWEPSFVPSPSEVKRLLFHGFSAKDVTAWADILLTRDTEEAVLKLADRMSGRIVDPNFVWTRLLQREFISARALRTILTILPQSLRLPKYRTRASNGHPVELTTSLLRHAREIWPQSLPSIITLFLTHLIQQDAVLPPAAPTQLQHLTETLNKLMSLVSLSTAILPFKDNIFQETAIIPILRYMDAHSPPLQITRPGYRAVVRIQLSQRKTPNEQQWAALKALSWPPWKVDRTAMDASVDLSYGITKARATLSSMRNAGYAPLAWEKSAEIYTGWDPDGTPTVQRRGYVGASAADEHLQFESASGRGETTTTTVLQRELLTKSDFGRKSSSTFWPARIDSTRTVQEAWACYLAWEDAKLPPNQAVYLAIMQKLHEAAKITAEGNEPQKMDDALLKKKQRKSSPPPPTTTGGVWNLLPGDTPTISPLPPSTHLYTYTRTPPPSLEDFYTTLLARGIRFTGHTLSFLLRTADLHTGLRRLRDALVTYPALSGILTLDRTYDLDKIPPEIFTAAVQLLARSGGYFLSAREWRWRRDGDISFEKEVYFKDHQLEISHLNKNSMIVRAVELLRRRPGCERMTWIAVFIGLTRETNFPGLGMALDTSVRHIDVEETGREIGLLGAVMAYGMTKRLVSLYKEQFEDLDPVAFLRFCLVSEGMVRGVWRVMLCGEAKSSEEERRVKEQVERWGHWGRYIENFAGSQELRKEFAALVGSEQRSERSGRKRGAMETERGEFELLLNLPRLLHIPNPALLHAYVRALGWLGDFEGLAEVVGWMRVYREEIGERAGRDRSGREMMRKVIVAVRVFCERSWRVDEVARNRKLGTELMSKRPPEEEIDVRLSKAADEELVEEIRGVVESVEEWEGWATDEEVGEYCADGRFDGLRG